MYRGEGREFFGVERGFALFDVLRVVKEVCGVKAAFSKCGECFSR